MHFFSWHYNCNNINKICKTPRKTLETWIWKKWFRITWHKFSRGKNLFLYLSTFCQKFLCCHGKLQSVFNNLSSFQSLFPHDWWLHIPCVLLVKAVTDFLEGHRVKALSVYNNMENGGKQSALVLKVILITEAAKNRDNLLEMVTIKGKCLRCISWHCFITRGHS